MTLLKVKDATLKEEARMKAKEAVGRHSRQKQVKSRLGVQFCKDAAAQALALAKGGGVGESGSGGLRTEVTCVAYIVNTLPRIPGQPSIQNKYIVSAGWDRRVYVWRDGGESNATKIQGYSLRMPEAEPNAATGHTDDILSIVFVPPNLVATGGYDGRVILWNLNSGDVCMRFQLVSGVESMLYLGRIKLLSAARSDGEVTFINTRMGVVHDTVNLQHARGEAIVALCSDSSNDYFFTGDSAGFVKVWDILDPRYDFDFLEQCTFWCAHKASRITSIDYVENPRILDTFLLTASSDGTIAMWTLNGAMVGQFGQKNAWSLDDSSTFRESTPNPLELEESDSEDELTDMMHSRLARLPSLVRMGERPLYRANEDPCAEDVDSDTAFSTAESANEFERRRSSFHDRKASFFRKRDLRRTCEDSGNGESFVGEQGRRFTKKDSMMMLKHQMLEEIAVSDRAAVMPQVGEVWYRQEEHASSTTPSTSGVASPSAAVEAASSTDDAGVGSGGGRMLNVVTVTHVDEARNILVGWNGLLHPERAPPSGPPKVHFVVTDFLKPRDKARWRKEAALSKRIGRIFCDPSGFAGSPSEPYKVLFMYYDADVGSGANACQMAREGVGGGSDQLAKHRWHAVDSMLRLHLLVPMSAHERPPRSMSIFRRRTSANIRDAAAAAELYNSARPPSNGSSINKRRSRFSAEGLFSLDEECVDSDDDSDEEEDDANPTVQCDSGEDAFTRTGTTTVSVADGSGTDATAENANLAGAVEGVNGEAGSQTEGGVVGACSDAPEDATVTAHPVDLGVDIIEDTQAASADSDANCNVASLGFGNSIAAPRDGSGIQAAINSVDTAVAAVDVPPIPTRTDAISESFVPHPPVEGGSTRLAYSNSHSASMATGLGGASRLRAMGHSVQPSPRLRRGRRVSQAVKSKRESFKYKQRVHKVVDVPSDYAALRRSLDNGGQHHLL